MSLKLTHMGLDVDEAMAYEIASGVVQHAARINNFVRIDMEGSPYTQRTLDFVHRLHRQPENAGHVGAVIQAYLFRSEKDVESLLAERIRIRLCKGAYKESPEISFEKKADTDANYVKLMKILLKSGVYHGIATHDENMIRATVEFAKKEKIPASAFEFQMLYGVRRDLQQKLVKEGWRMPGLYSVWHGVVSLPDAAAGRASGKCDFYSEEFIPVGAFAADFADERRLGFSRE